MKGVRTKAYLEYLIKEKNIPYLDICVGQGQDTIFRCFSDKQGKATGEEQLYLYSCTKPLTVIGAMRLVECGVIGLDDLVEKYLPSYANTFILNEAGEPTPTKNKMTLRHLFTMSGGLTYDIHTQPLQELKKTTSKTVDIVNGFIKTPLSFEPGARFQYSLCHDVLAAVVEIASGKRFSQYMQEEIFAPLGMVNTGFHNMPQTFADMYEATADGGVRQIAPINVLGIGSDYDSGGAGVISRVEDYAKFARALACGGETKDGYRLIGNETLRRIYRKQHSSMAVDNGFTCVQGEEYGYGLGMRTRLKETEWGLPIGEFGWDGAAGAYLMVDPIHKISVVIGMHVLTWPYVFAGEHLKLVQCVYEDMREEGLL